MAEQLELSLPVEQSEQAVEAKAALIRAQDQMEHAKYLHDILMNTLRERVRTFKADFQKKCTHPSTKIVDDFDYHKREDWKEEMCEECGLILRRW